MNDAVNGDTAPAGGPAAQEGDSGNVDKIRDILFGSQMRDYDKRFAALEERLLRESAALRDDLSKRLTATEHYLRGELDTLTANLSTEQRERAQSVHDVMDALSNVNRDLTERIAALAEQSSQQHRELRAQLNDAQRLIGDEMDRRHQSQTDALRREAFDLRSAKTDRSALAAMFAELAQRLSLDAGDR